MITDPPFGASYHNDSGRFTGGDGNHKNVWNGPIEGDQTNFDPSRWIEFPKVVLWGSNHFANRLPTGTTLVWVKRNEWTLGSFLSDGEIGWMKGGSGVYCYKDVSMNAAGANFKKWHENQKPRGLAKWWLDQAKVTDDDIVLDPYMGSGTTIIEAFHRGCVCIGIEKVEQKFMDAVHRIRIETSQISLGIE